MAWRRSRGGIAVIVLERCEQRIEPVMALLPVLPVAGQPPGRVPQRLGLEMAEAGGGPGEPSSSGRLTGPTGSTLGGMGQTPDEMLSAVSASLAVRTGRSLDEWVALVQAHDIDPIDQNAVRHWLRSEHGVAQNS